MFRFFLLLLFLGAKERNDMYICMSKSKGDDTLVIGGVEVETMWDFVF